MADDRDGTTAAIKRGRFLIFGNERSAEKRLHTEHREEAARHSRARYALRFGSIRAEVGAPGPVGSGAREEIGLLRPIGEVEIRNVAVGKAGCRILAFE